MAARCHSSVSAKVARLPPFERQRQKVCLEHNINQYPLIGRPCPSYRRLNDGKFEQWNSTLRAGEVEQDIGPRAEAVTLRGRVRAIRKASKSLVFYDICADGREMQIVADLQRSCGHRASDDAQIQAQRFHTCTRILHVGDIAEFCGVMGKTDAGQLSLFVQDANMRLLAPCLHQFPAVPFTETQKRFQSRHVDLLIDSRGQKAILARHRMTQSLRQFLTSRDFVEVETPILAPSHGGANAEPFVTSSHALGDSADEKSVQDSRARLELRCAPELWLKRLVVGGFDRVFEIGRVFRNEGIDASHNPEYSSVEFYQAYGSLDDAMELTEQIMRELCVAVVGKVSFSLTRESGAVEVDLAKQFRRIDYVQEIERALSCKLPTDMQEDETTHQALSQLLLELPGGMPWDGGARLMATMSVARILDSLAKAYIEPQCMQPTFVVNHPHLMSPLSKAVRGPDETLLARRFELYVAGTELANAYEEQNDPIEQMASFKSQMHARTRFGDTETLPYDQSYIDCLTWGLPPTCGWGMGLDRYLMMLLDYSSISEVLAFGGLHRVRMALQR